MCLLLAVDSDNKAASISMFYFNPPDLLDSCFCKMLLKITFLLLHDVSGVKR